MRKTTQRAKTPTKAKTGLTAPIETGLTKNQFISAFMQSVHGHYEYYVPAGKEMARQDPEFLAHMIAYDRLKGSINDTKVALPVIALSIGQISETEFVENSIAHMLTLDPRNLEKAVRFAKGLKIPPYFREVQRAVGEYLAVREASPKVWDRTAISFRRPLKALYGLSHAKPTEQRTHDILFKENHPKNSIFEAVANLHRMSSTEAASAIMTYRIPLLTAVPALGKKAIDTELVLALISRMSATELVTNSKILEKMGVNTNPALRAAYEEGLKKVAKSKKAVLKTTEAATQVKSTKVREQLRGAQEKQIDNLGKRDSNEVILADASGSMEAAIEIARQLAALQARTTSGKVWVVFFNNTARFVDVTGLGYDQILEKTRYIKAGGGTSIGIGLNYVEVRKLEADVISIVSDAQENGEPRFVDVYKRYIAMCGKDIPVYLYRCSPGMTSLMDVDLALSMKYAGFDVQEFDLRGEVDYYSLPNIVNSMRANKFSLVDEVMETPLLTRKEALVLKRKED